jgi:hypothetical protein
VVVRDSALGLVICLLVMGYIWCIYIIATTFGRLFEKGRSRWPIPIVLVAMFFASGWFADLLHVKEVAAGLFFAVPACCAVGLLYLGIVKFVER